MTPIDRKESLLSRKTFASIFWLATGVFYFVGGMTLGVGTLSSPSPGFFPVLFSAILILLALVQLIIELHQRSKNASVPFWKNAQSPIRILTVALTVIFYTVILNHIGYLITTTIFLFFLVKVLAKKGWLAAIIYSIGLTLVSYTVFRILFEVPLPKGIMGL